jgi:hypothetical protein
VAEEKDEDLVLGIAMRRKERGGVWYRPRWHATGSDSTTTGVGGAAREREMGTHQWASWVLNKFDLFQIQFKLVQT